MTRDLESGQAFFQCDPLSQGHTPHTLHPSLRFGSGETFGEHGSVLGDRPVAWRPTLVSGKTRKCLWLHLFEEGGSILLEAAIRRLVGGAPYTSVPKFT